MEKGLICRIRDLSRAIEAYSQAFEAAFGMSLTQAILLCQLRDEPDMGPGELASALGLTGSHASKQLAQLEMQRLVKRRLCKDDRRCMRFSLTKDGLRRLSELESADLPLPADLLRVFSGGTE